MTWRRGGVPVPRAASCCANSTACANSSPASSTPCCTMVRNAPVAASRPTAWTPCGIASPRRGLHTTAPWRGSRRWSSRHATPRSATTAGCDCCACSIAPSASLPSASTPSCCSTGSSTCSKPSGGAKPIWPSSPNSPQLSRGCAQCSKPPPGRRTTSNAIRRWSMNSSAHRESVSSRRPIAPTCCNGMPGWSSAAAGMPAKAWICFATAFMRRCSAPCRVTSPD
ncbi:hypothetical protein GALL_538430 [mine drainage metagenome]|uniref:Uncharacterized protein n=1 Tax=mine drainage metagenome TaxID=410659 RepID=A0A1J5PM28_9ZZZZ